MDINMINIAGNLTKDPEIKQTPSGKTVCNLSLAHNHSYFKNKEKINKVSYFDIEYWANPLAKDCVHLTKGSRIAVYGRLIQERWEKDGKLQGRIKIVADGIQYLSRKKETERNAIPQRISAEDVLLN